MVRQSHRQVAQLLLASSVIVSLCGLLIGVLHLGHGVAKAAPDLIDEIRLFKLPYSLWSCRCEGSSSPIYVRVYREEVMVDHFGDRQTVAVREMEIDLPKLTQALTVWKAAEHRKAYLFVENGVPLHLVLQTMDLLDSQGFETHLRTPEQKDLVLGTCCC